MGSRTPPAVFFSILNSLVQDWRFSCMRRALSSTLSCRAYGDANLLMCRYFSGEEAIKWDCVHVRLLMASAHIPSLIYSYVYNMHVSAKEASVDRGVGNSSDGFLSWKSAWHFWSSNRAQEYPALSSSHGVSAFTAVYPVSALLVCGNYLNTVYLYTAC